MAVASSAVNNLHLFLCFSHPAHPINITSEKAVCFCMFCLMVGVVVIHTEVCFETDVFLLFYRAEIAKFMERVPEVPEFAKCTKYVSPTDLL